MSEITLEEAIQYMREASEHEKNKQFRKFVEQAVELLKIFAENVTDLELLIELFLGLTDDYLQTKNPELLKEALNYLDIEDDLSFVFKSLSH